MPIRQAVKFHEGGDLSPVDVEYTFERGLLQDRRGGPQWMFWESLSGYQYYGLLSFAKDVLGDDTLSRDDILTLSAEDQAKVYNELKDWVRVSDDGLSVIFTLGADYPPFLGMLAHAGSWGAILDKEWVVSVGGWDGAPDTWAEFYNPGGGVAAEESELYDKANGTGPYYLDLWDPGVERVYERFDGYWRDPAPIATVIHRQVQEWTDRFLPFENHDADIVSVDPQYVPQVEILPGVTVHKNLPSISMNPVMFFTSSLAMDGNPFVGSGEFAEDGILGDFFNDVHVRRAFASAFDYDLFITESYGAVGGYKTHGPIPQAFAWAYNPDPAMVPVLDLEVAKQELELAFGGDLWDTGFTFTIVYNEGNDSRRSMAEMIEINIESLNPKFHIDILGMPWTNQLDYLVTTQMPLFIIGWIMDYPDPHNFAQPFQQSDGGGYAEFQGDYLISLYAEHFDALILAGMQTTDVTERQAIYYELSRLSTEYATHIWLPQVNGYRVATEYVQGWAFNPGYPDPYFYSIYKAIEAAE